MVAGNKTERGIVVRARWLGNRRFSLDVWPHPSPAIPFILTRPTDNPAAPTAPHSAADVRPFAGKTAEIKFEFRSIYGYDDFLGGPRIPFDLPNAQNHVLDDQKSSALPASVPEPGTYALFALGFAALAVHLRRQRP